MQHELGWEVVNCYDEWSGGVCNQVLDGKAGGGVGFAAAGAATAESGSAGRGGCGRL